MRIRGDLGCSFRLDLENAFQMCGARVSEQLLPCRRLALGADDQVPDLPRHLGQVAPGHQPARVRPLEPLPRLHQALRTRRPVRLPRQPFAPAPPTGRRSQERPIPYPIRRRTYGVRSRPQYARTEQQAQGRRQNPPSCRLRDHFPLQFGKQGG